ncbi:MAG: efflux RND transporter permease subunit [Planctomycetota bacterium]
MTLDPNSTSATASVSTDVDTAPPSGDGRGRILIDKPAPQLEPVVAPESPALESPAPKSPAPESPAPSSPAPESLGPARHAAGGWIAWCVSNPVKVSVAALLLVLFGTVAVQRMPVQLAPEVVRPTISVETDWPGASPREIEREIVLEQERQLKGVEGVQEMFSTAEQNKCEIELNFAVGTDMDQALLRVNSRLQQVRDYPENAEKPVIRSSSNSRRPIAWFVLTERVPKPDEIRAFAAKNPELASALSPALQTKNPARRLSRLRQAAERNPKIADILPADIEITHLQRFAEEEVQTYLERVDGVAGIRTFGGLLDEMQVIVDPARLASRGLTLDNVREVLTGQNRDISGGSFAEGKRDYTVRVLGQFKNEAEIRSQVLAVQDGVPITVGDVARVRLGYKKPSGVVRRFGDYAISLGAQRENDANVVETMRGLRVAVESLNRDLLGPRGLQLVQVSDETEYIDAAVRLVNQNIVAASALTMIVLMLFLHLGRATLIAVPLVATTAVLSVFVSPWLFVITLGILLVAGLWFARGALVVGLAIPISIVGSLLVLWLLGRTLNVISLAGLAFAVGMLVDSAVVVLENIVRHHAMGLPRWRAAIRGTSEVWGAVVASTLTTVAVFLPILFVQQEAGQLFRDIAIAISAGVGLSMLVSTTVIPTATARLLHDAPENVPAGMTTQTSATPEHSAVTRWFTRAGGRLLVVVQSINDWLLRGGVLRRLGAVVTMTGAAAVIAWVLFPPVEYLPAGNRNRVFGSFNTPAGYNSAELRELGKRIEEHLEPYWTADPSDENADELAYPIIRDYFVYCGSDDVFVGLSAEDPLRAGELADLLKELQNTIPDVDVSASQSSLFGRGRGGRSIEIDVTGPELEQLIPLAREVIERSRVAIPDGQANASSSLEMANPELHIRPDGLQTQALGLSTASIGYAVDALVDGAFAGDYFLDGQRIDLTILASEETVQRSQDLLQQPIATPTGELVPLSAVAIDQPASGPQLIRRRERQRALTVESMPPDDMPLSVAMDRIRDDVVTPLREAGQLEGGYRIILGGSADKLVETWQALRFNLLFALLITYLLLAALFESWLYPLVIILSVPWGAVGGVVALRGLDAYLRFTNDDTQPLDVLTMMGFVILIGTVVNNPILIVHQSLQRIRDGLGRRDAIRESVVSRVRPIFMTTTTTMLGLLPLVFFPGAGSELYRGLAAVMVGGLATSTLVSLLLVPVLLTLALEVKTWASGCLRTPGERVVGPVEAACG